MSDVVRLRTRAEIEDEAAVWAWRLDSGSMSVADQAAFDEWLRRDPRHRREFDDLAEAWSALDILADGGRHQGRAAITGRAGAAPPGARARWWAAAAAIVVLSVAALAVLQRGTESQTLATAVGQQREATLADGSVVMLNTNTILETNFRRRMRDVILRKGEAHFQVAHDRSRPFLVHAGDAVVRAVGTQFEVRVLSNQHVDIVVDEGRVEVQSAASAIAKVPGIVRALGAGQQMSTAKTGYAVTPVTSEQLSSVLAWRQGAVVFDGQPLSEAVAEIERYTDARIMVSDPRIAALRVGGRFRTGDLQEFFAALQTALPVAVHRSSNGVMIIDPKP